jgi:hypothetical protein
LLLALLADLCACQQRTAEGQMALHPRALAPAGAPALARPSARAPRPASVPARAPASAPVAPEPSGFTFFVAADVHYGFEDVRESNRRMIDEMNHLPGYPYPIELGGHVQRPVGVLVAGDLTENGKPAEWRQFLADFGLTGREGLLRYPVFEATGNHDRRGGGHAVLPAVRGRHGSLTYSWDWHGVHFACLDLFPTVANRRWLVKDLAQLRPRQQVVLFFHYNLEGPFSRDFGPVEQAAFHEAIAAHNVIAIFHGHYHPEQRYIWRGIDVFDVGSPFWDTTFAVVRVTERQLQVASWNWIERRWGSLFSRALGPGPAFAPPPPAVAPTPPAAPATAPPAAPAAGIRVRTHLTRARLRGKLQACRV